MELIPTSRLFSENHSQPGSYVPDAGRRSLSWLRPLRQATKAMPVACLSAAAWLVMSAPLLAETTEKKAEISLSADTELIKTGHLELDETGGRTALEAPVVVTVENPTGKPVETKVELGGKDAERAKVLLNKTEEEEGGRLRLHISVFGLKPTFEDTELFLHVQALQEGQLRAEKKIPVRVVVPMVVLLPKEEDRPFYEGQPNPGLVNRAVNNRTIPKISVFYPEAKLASMLLHDLELKVLDQFQEPLPPIYEGAPIFCALGESNFEYTNRRLRADSTFLDTMGLWQFVGEVSDITVEPGRTEVQAFVSRPAPPCSERQYGAYEPLIIQWQVGGYRIGTYKRQLTLINTGDHHHPKVKITLELLPDPEMLEEQSSSEASGQ